MQTKAKERMWLNKKRDALVVDGHKDASVLYAAAGDVIPESAKEKFGIGDNGLIKGDAAKKQRDKNGDKSRKGGEDKSRKDGEKKGGQPNNTGDDFSSLKGIGAKTATSLVAGGVDTFAALSEVDLDNPPAIEGLAANPDWKSWKEQAAALVKATA